MEEKIILNVQIDEGEINKAVKGIQDARKKIDELKASQKELEKQGEKNSEQYILQENEIKNLSKGISENSKTLQTNTSMVQANENSIESLRIANSKLTKERNTLDLTTEAGTKRLKEINDQLDKNNTQIRDNVSALEKQKINIGNYQSALDGIVPGLGGMTQGLVDSTQASGGFGKGIMSMVKASLAFIATPLGAILAAIVAAFKVLQVFIQNSTKGMDLFEQAADAVGAVVNVLVDRVVQLVSALGKLLTGDLMGGLEDMRDSFSGIGDEIEREAKAAVELRKAMQDLEDAQVNYDIAASKNENTIKRLILASKNRTATENERIAAIDEALQIEKKQTEELIKLKEEGLRIANDEAAKRINLARISGESEAAFAQRLIDTGLVIDDNRNKVKDALIDRNNAEGQSLAFQEKIQNMRDAIAEKADGENQKRKDKKAADDEKERQRLEEMMKAEMDAAQQITLNSIESDIAQTKSVEDRVQKEIALEEVKRNFLLQNEKLTSGQVALINQTTETAITDIRAKGIADRKALEEKDNAERAAAFDKMVNDQIEQLEIQTQADINAEKEKFLNGLISREDYEQQLSDLELGFLIARQEINKQFGDEDLRLTEEILDSKIAAKTKEHDISIALEQHRAAIIADLFGQTAGLFKKQTIAYKALASAQALIQTWQSAQSVFTGFTSEIPGPVGMALGIVAAAAAVAGGLANVARINNVKLREGGVLAVDGPGHEQGGVPLSIGNKQVAEIEGGEHVVVLKRGANEKLKMLSRANVLAGGRDFYNNRAPVRYAADGGFVASSITNKVDTDLTLRSIGNVVGSAIERAPAPVLRITELERVQTNAGKAVSISELS